jgi:transcription termination factor Rho
MPVLDRTALVDSPLADLHAIASELSIDGFRRLRRAELIDAIIAKQGGESPSADDDAVDEAPRPRRRSRSAARGAGDAKPAADDDATSADADADAKRAAATAGTAPPADDDGEAAPRPRRSRSRSRSSAPAPTADVDDEAATPPAEADDAPARPARSRAGGGRRGRGSAAASAPAEREPAARDREPDGGQEDGDEIVEGVVELLPGGSGFVRVAGPEPSDDDVYISSAQVKRCELVSGDAVSGPKRAPRRSERFASLIRIETINGRPASEQADNVRFDDLPAGLPSTVLGLGGEDPTLKAIETLTPFGRGSRVTITGPSRAGKTETLRLIAAALAAQDDLTISVALAGIRPEEIGEWSADAVATPEPATALSFAASDDARTGALEAVVDQARRQAARGSHAVVLIDTLDGLSAHAARRIMASARSLTGGGSVTIIATASAPIGGETTTVALDLERTGTGRFPAIDLLASGTLRPEALVGVTAAKKILRERAKLTKD